jgi:hypothetical protein
MPTKKSIEISISPHCTGAPDCMHRVEAAVQTPKGWLGMCIGHMNISNLEGTTQLLRTMVTR